MAQWHWPAHLGGPRTRAQVIEELRQSEAEHQREGFAYWWWRERDSGELVGMIGLHRTDVEGEPAVEIGWSLAPGRWGQGLATEAAHAALAWGFEERGLDRIVAFAMVENEASQGVMKRVGMTFVREFERKGFPHVLYEIRPGDH